MQRYIVRRFLLFIPTLLIASVLLFSVLRILPGDVALVILSAEGGLFTEEEYQGLRETMGLNESFPVQLGKWYWAMLNGQFGGRSLLRNEPISSLIGQAFPVTLLLTGYTIIIATVISLPLGVLAALYQDRWPDYLIRVLAIFGLAMPSFWVAFMIILGLVIIFGWVPPVIYSQPWDNPWEHMQLMIWPVLVLVWLFGAYLIRVTRASMLEVLRQDYMRTARSKGLQERTILARHGLRNVLIPVATLGGGFLGSLLSGTVILETVFGVPGIGLRLVEAAQNRDFPVVQSLGMLLVVLTLTINLLIDLSYSIIDPRISYR